MKPTGLNIKAASQLSGVSVHTIRAWEKRYQAVSPERSYTGRRLYSFLEVERIRMLMKAVSQGYAISQVANLSNAELQVRVQLQGPQRGEQWGQRARLTAIEACDQVLDSVLEFRLDAVRTIFQRAARGFEVEALVFEFFLPLFRKCDEAVAKKTLLSAQAEVVRTLARHLLMELVFDGGQTLEPGSTVMVSSLLAHDSVELAALLSALLVSERGYSPFYIGAGVSPEALIEAANARRVGALLIRTAEGGKDSSEPALFKALTQLDLGLHSAAEIWIGGSAFERVLAFKWKHRVRHFSQFEDFNDLSFVHKKER